MNARPWSARERTCEFCESVLVRRSEERDGQWARRRFCNPTCSNRYRSQTGNLSKPRKPASETTYSGLHYRVAALRGKPSRCERCGTEDPTKTYEWANLTGNYEDPDDYERLCRSCHRRFDNERNPQSAKTHCPAGHPYDEANTVRYGDGRRRCRICSNEQARLSKARIRGMARR